MDITPKKIRTDLKDQNYLKALVSSLRLGEKYLIRECVETVPPDSISLLSQQLSLTYLSPLLAFIAEEAEHSRHVQFYLTWTKSILYNHGNFLKTESKQFTPLLNLLIKNLSRKSDELRKICDFNKYTMKYLIGLSQIKGEDNDEEEDDEQEEVETIVKETSLEDSDDDDMAELATKWDDDD